MNPPQPGEESYAQFMNEKNAVLSSLAQRAKMVADRLNNMPGITCNTVQGAMYAFPRVSILLNVSSNYVFRCFHYATVYFSYIYLRKQFKKQNR